MFHVKQVRRLQPGDEAAVEAFLRPRAETSMFLRANLRETGFLNQGRPYDADYFAIVDGTAIRGVVSHACNGTMLLQAPENAADLAIEAARASARPVTALIGPWRQVVEARRALGLENAG